MRFPLLIHPSVRTDLVNVYDDDIRPDSDAFGSWAPRAGPNDVHVVNPANSQSVDETKYVTHVMAKNNKFLTADADEGDASLVFSYDDDDTFIDRSGAEGREVSMEKFETLIDDDNNSNTIANANAAGAEDDVTVEVVIYNADGISVFRVTSDGSQ